MIEMTSGKLDVWTLRDLNSDDLPEWLQSKQHMTTDPQHPFLLVDVETDTNPQNSLMQYADCTEVYNDGRYIVYDFATANAVHEAAEAIRAAG